MEKKRQIFERAVPFFPISGHTTAGGVARMEFRVCDALETRRRTKEIIRIKYST